MTASSKTILFRRRLTAWYRKNRRDLQWRTTTDPYAILVSEIMLQQTQVARVQEKLPAFLAEFPDFRSLARTSRGDVLRAWKGMGYNNRAVRLHELARIVTGQHEGSLPADVDALMALPGIGKYTAHAVACFAFGAPVPVVDVNIVRVLSRIYHRMPEPGAYRKIDAIWERADAILPRNAFDWNQALMDLGATICTARAPQCPICPVRDLCASRPVLSTIRKPSPAKAARPADQQQAAQEPMHAGVPRRFWRGRIVEALRQVKPGTTISLPRLGKAVKKDFSAGDLPWLHSVVHLLAQDGVVHLRRHRSGFHASLAE